MRAIKSNRVAALRRVRVTFFLLRINQFQAKNGHSCDVQPASMLRWSPLFKHHDIAWVHLGSNPGLCPELPVVMICKGILIERWSARSIRSWCFFFPHHHLKIYRSYHRRNSWRKNFLASFVWFLWLRKLLARRSKAKKWTLYLTTYI